MTKTPGPALPQSLLENIARRRAAICWTGANRTASGPRAGGLGTDSGFLPASHDQPAYRIVHCRDRSFDRPETSTLPWRHFLTMASRAVSPKASICAEKQHLSDLYIEAVRQIMQLEDAEIAAVISGGVGLERFDLALQVAREKRDRAKLAFTLHA